MKCFVSTALGLEPLLAAELQSLDCQAVKPTRAGCYLEAEPEDIYRVSLWSRTASRLLLPMLTAPAESGDHLYQLARELNWQDWIAPVEEIAIDFSGTNAEVRHTNFGSLRIKDGLADWCRAQGRPVPRLSGDANCRISARLRKGRLELALDLSGEGLHRRGYRRQMGVAPLRESLAAALLQYAGWPNHERFGDTLFDPMCGSGTLLIEAACMAIDRAPGVDRQRWGFQSWLNHDEARWQSVLAAAKKREAEGRARWQGRIVGADLDHRAVQGARANIAAAELTNLIQVEHKPLENAVRPAPAGLLITNPPYGERLQDRDGALTIYRALGDLLKREFGGWEAAILAPEAAMGQAIGIHSHRSLSFFNGALECKLYLFRIDASEFLRPAGPVVPSAGAHMVANRIGKNMQRLKSWRKQQQINAWRCYDRDLSEYAAAVDIYEAQAERYALVQEYAAPKTVDPTLARHRLNELVTGVELATGIKAENVLLRRRERQRGAQQYEKQDADATRECIVNEGGARFVVNLTDYLDTGLFLDHRPVRRYIQRHIDGGRLLNLFCYTASATVQAAQGGASESLSLDMSNTYLAWAERNFALNHMDLQRHQLLRADCLEWLQEDRSDRFDMILLDPPSFSNSKRMAEVLDVADDHPDLIRSSMKLLAPGGTLIFSSNRRGLKLDAAIREEFQIEDFSAASIDPDFERHSNIHQCWLIRHG